MVFQAFSLYRLYPSLHLVLAVCCRPFVECTLAILVFSLLWRDLSSPFVSAPWPSRYWDDVRLLSSSFVQLLVATFLHRTTLWTSLMTRSISCTLSVVLICQFLRGVYSYTTQLNSTDPVEQRIAKSVVFLFMTVYDLQTESTVVHAIEFSSVQFSWVELCRYKHPFTHWFQFSKYTLLALPILVCRSCYLLHSCPDNKIPQPFSIWISVLSTQSFEIII